MSGDLEKLHDFANPNPSSFPTKVNQLEGRYSDGFYHTMREGGYSKTESVAMAGLWFVYDVSGLTGLVQAYEGEDVLTGRPLSDGDRISGGIAGAVQLATLGLGVKGVSKAPAAVPKAPPRVPVGELPPALPRPVEVPGAPVEPPAIPPALGERVAPRIEPGSATKPVVPVGDPAIPIPKGHTRVYRAVSEAEYEQILRTGSFEVPPGKPGVSPLDGKWFCDTPEGAVKFGNSNMGPGAGKFRLIEADVPDAAPGLFKVTDIDRLGTSR